MHASNPETIYSAGSGDWTQARLITVSGSARTGPMSHRDQGNVPFFSPPCYVIKWLFRYYEFVLWGINSHSPSQCRRGTGTRGTSPPFLNFSLWEKIFRWKFFFSKIRNLGVEMPHFVEILSTHTSFVRNLQLSVGKLQFSAPILLTISINVLISSFLLKFVLISIL